MWQTALKHSRNPAVRIRRRCCSSPSSGRSGGLPCLQDEVIVGSSLDLVQSVGSQVEVRPGFITDEEEAALLEELEPGLRKKRYEFDHWDDVRHAHCDCRDMSGNYNVIHKIVYFSDRLKQTDV